MFERFDLYNPELKKEYALKFDGADSTVITNLTAFAKATATEREFDKDIYAFNHNEIWNLIMSLGASSESSVNRYVSIFKDYVNWCMLKGVRGIYENNINNLEIFQKTEDMTQFVSNRKVANKHLSKKEFKRMIDSLNNPIDQLLLLMPYNFVLGEEAYEIRNLKYDDINFEDNTVTVFDIDNTERKVVVSNEFLEVAKDTNFETVYLSNNGQEDEGGFTSKRNLIKSEYLIKPTKRGDNDFQMAKYAFITNRMYLIKRYTGYEEITLTSIRDSRIMHLIEENYITGDYVDINDAIFYTYEEIKNNYGFELSNMQKTSIKNSYLQLRELKEIL